MYAKTGRTINFTTKMTLLTELKKKKITIISEVDMASKLKNYLKRRPVSFWNSLQIEDPNDRYVCETEEKG